ncbi:MAG: hypothetical protein NT168_17295 [Planctomycetota bacterium]|jgi:hypothetical protein|nr:hypothetical protein [Planctomycetota bacterium]
MNEPVVVEIASDQTHEKVVAEIIVDGKFVCVLSNDHDELIVEFPGPGLDESLVARTVSLESLLRGVEIAKARLRV